MRKKLFCPSSAPCKTHANHDFGATLWPPKLGKNGNFGTNSVSFGAKSAFFAFGGRSFLNCLIKSFDLTPDEHSQPKKRLRCNAWAKSGCPDHAIVPVPIPAQKRCVGPLFFGKAVSGTQNLSTSSTFHQPVGHLLQAHFANQRDAMAHQD